MAYCHDKGVPGLSMMPIYRVKLLQFTYRNRFPVLLTVAFFVGDMTPAECKAQWYEINGNKVKWTEKEDVVSEIF